MILAIIGLIILAVAGVVLWFARRTQYKVNLLGMASPTSASEVANAFPGEMVSLSGTARGEQELLSEHGRTPCIYYQASIIREYERTRRTGGSTRGGSRQTRSRGSETLHSYERSVPFYVEDASGRVRVEPHGAEFDARETMNRFEPAYESGGSITFGGVNINLGTGYAGDRTLGYRYQEHVIPVDQHVFVLGVVNESTGIARPPSNRPNAGFLISYRDEDTLRHEWQRTARWMAYGSIGGGIVGLLMIAIGLAIEIL